MYVCVISKVYIATRYSMDALCKFCLGHVKVFHGFSVGASVFGSSSVEEDNMKNSFYISIMKTLGGLVKQEFLAGAITPLILISTRS